MVDMSDWRIIPAENMVAAFQVLLSSWLEQQYHKHGMAGFCGLSPCKSKMLMHLDRHCCSSLDSHVAIGVFNASAQQNYTVLGLQPVPVVMGWIWPAHDL